MAGGSQYVSKLNEYAQKQQLKPPDYEDLGSSGPDHMKVFTQRVRLDGQVFPEGIGKNKKEARHNAAKNAYEILFKGGDAQTAPEDSSQTTNELCGDNKSGVNSEGQDATNFITKISEYCQQRKLSYNYIEVKREGPSHNYQFFYKLVIDKKDFPEANGKTVKEARQIAAQLAYNKIMDSKMFAGAAISEDDPSTITEPSTALTEHSVTADSTNFITKISEYCQQKKFSYNYIEVKREGPSHNYEFFYKLVIDEKEFPVATGKSKKKAQQMAAQLAWTEIQKHDLDSKASLGSSMSEDETASTASSTTASLSETFAVPNSNGSDWIQFKHSSKSCTEQVPSSVPDAVQEKKSANNPPTTSAESKFSSDYDIIEIIGKGSYGCVYKARKKELDKYYAIKEIQSKDKEKSLQEVKVLSDLLHPNIVRYYTFWFEDTRAKSTRYKCLFIEMELCDGGTLRHWIHEMNKESSPESRKPESLNLAQQILDGVEYIHKNKLIHRDLKPENIFFGQDGKVRIGDFGLATHDSSDGGEIMERTENRGTRTYMAPEQVGTNYDRKVDIFALGLIFFELFWRIGTGHERGKVWTDIRNQNFPKEFTASYLPESNIIKTMLNEKPEDRPEASALKSDLEKWSKAPEWNTDQRNQTY